MTIGVEAARRALREVRSLFGIASLAGLAACLPPVSRTGLAAALRTR